MAGATDSAAFLDGMSSSIKKANDAVNKFLGSLTKLAERSDKIASRIDGFTASLKNSSDALSKATSGQKELTRSSNKLADVHKQNLNAITKMSDSFTKLQGRMQKTAAAGDSFNAAKNKSGSNKAASGAEEFSAKGFKGFLKQAGSSLSGMVGKYLTFDNVKNLAANSIGGAMDNQRMRDLYIARTGSNREGGSMFDALRTQAVRSGVNVNDSLKGSLQMLNKTQDAGQVTKMTGLAQRLAAFDPSGGGIKDAMTQMNDVMSGKLTSLATRLQIPESSLRGLKLDKMAAGMDWKGLSATLDKLLSDREMSQEHYNDLQKEPGQQWDAVKNNATAALQDAGQGALAALQPFFTMLNDAFQAGKFQPFFDALAIGFQLVGNIATAVASFILDHLDLVKTILFAIGIVAAIVGAVWLISWLTAALPVIALIGIITGLLLLLNQMGVTVGDVIGFVTGVFYGLFAFLWNNIAYFYNMFLSVAEFLANIFIDPVYAIKKLFYDLVKNVSGFFDSISNGIIDGLNWLIEKLNKVTNADISLIPKVDSKWVDELKPESNKNVVNFDKYKMDFKDIGELSSKGFNAGRSLPDKLSSATDKLNSFGKGWGGNDPLADNANKFGLGKQKDLLAGVSAQQNPMATSLANIGNVDRVGSIGKVEDTVDISSEDLQMMHDIAEMSSIQNFVSLTPTVNVTTGDIKNGYDVDTIINRIQSKLENEIAVSAQGVYA